MKIPTLLLKKKKLRATTARRSLATADDLEYEEMSEPNMKLSRALLIVLVLHVVAVAGIVAFNTIKSRQGALPPQTATPSAVASQPAETAAPAVAMAEATPAKALPVETRRAEPVKAALPAAAAGESGNFYVVAKGDNPVKIAKKLKVSESELLAVNHIDDPRKLQIGQKLIVPTKAAKPKKPGE